MKNINISNPTFENITEMKSVFKDCKSLSKIDLSFINTSKLKSVYNLFYGCSNLQHINLSKLILNADSFNTIEEMFTGCKKLKEIVLSCFLLIFEI